MASELIPVVDLRLLSQAELNALSLSSPNAFDLRRFDDVVVPKIDRSVFNESAGSRKQTYSRLRLAPRKPDAAVGRPRSRTLLPSAPAPAPAPSPARDDDPSRGENEQIVTCLRQLFAREDSTSTPGPIQSQPQPQPQALALALALASPPASGVSADEVSRALVLVEDRDKEILSVNGVAVDVVALGEMENPFGEELRRRTEGMVKDEELLGFLQGLDGQWGSRRKKRKIVEAAGFGDHLPRGWKLLLGLRRKEGVTRLDCRRYISPNGKQFVSCKEVASYILSLVGHQDARQQISGQIDSDSPGLDNLTPGCAAGSTHQFETTMEKSSCLSITPTSISAVQDKQSVLVRVENQMMIEPKKVLECHKCNLNFGDKDALVQHLLSFHQSAKKRRLGKSIGDGVILKDGKYECQFCHKMFSERRRYNGHIGAHVRYQGLTVEAFSDENTTRYIVNPTPLATVPFSETDVLINKSEATCTANSVDRQHVGSSSCRLEMEDHEVDRNVKHGEPETSEAYMTKSVDYRINNCDATRDVSENIVENCKVMDIESNVCTDAISPSVIDVNYAAQDCFPNISQETSLSKPVDDQINDFSMNGYRSKEIIENSSIKAIKPNECSNGAYPLLSNVDCGTVNTTSMSKHVDSQICDFDMDGSKSEVIAEDSSVKDIIPNECLNAVSPPLTSTDDATCETFNENVLLSMSNSMAGINSQDMIVCKSEKMVDHSNATCMEHGSCLDGLSPSLINLDSMTFEASNEINLSSCTMNSGVEKYSGEQKIESKNALLTTSGNGSSYGVENSSNGIFISTMEDQELVETDISSNEMQNEIGSYHVLSDKGTIMGNTMRDELGTKYITPDDSRHPGGITNSADCTFQSDMKASMNEEMNKLGNDLEICFHSSNTEDDAGDAIVENGGRISLHANVANTSWIQSSDGLPILDMIPEQCEDVLSGVGQKLGKISEFKEPRMDGTQPSEFDLLAAQESGSASQPTDELGYAAELESGIQPSMELDWSMSLPNMVGGCGLKAACMWCGEELNREGISAELQPDMVGFICPTCKKISGPHVAENLPGESSLP